MTEPPGVVASVLLVADPGPWRRATSDELHSEGFEVVLDDLADLGRGWAIPANDLALVDLSLATRSAVAVCAAIRARSTTPILAVDRADDEDMVVGALAAGADHLAPARSTTREIVARVRALLRRFPPRPRSLETPASVGHLTLDRRAEVALVGGSEVPLVGAEVDVLQALLHRAGRVVSRAELARGRWSADEADRSLDLVIRRLRDKLEAVDDHRCITTVRGVGFRLDLPPVAASLEDAR